MNPSHRERLRNFFRAPVFSPAGFLARAFLIAVAYGLCELAGLREYTTLLSGTTVLSRWQWSVFLGVAYMVVHFCFVLGVPILVIAAAVMGILQRVFTPKFSQ